MSAREDGRDSLKPRPSREPVESAGSANTVVDGHQAMRAVCRSAGWEFCEEHKRPLTYRNGCAYLHLPSEPSHEYWCEWPDRECICP